MAAMNLRGIRILFTARNSNLLHSKIHTSKIYYADDSPTKTNLYETLKISSSASQNEIKQAYYDLTLKYHPDRNENCKDAATKFREVREAYEILGNYGLRKKYDKGVPLTIVKKTVKRTPVNHDVKFQEFFDSRTAQSSSNTQDEEISKLSSGTKMENVEDKDEDTRENRNIVQFITAMFLCCVVAVSHYR